MDRSAVLLLGVCAGAAIGLSFLGRPGSAGSAVIPQSCAARLQSSAGVAPEVAAARWCAAPAQRQLLATLKKGAPVRVAIFGDSFGDGVWWGLMRQLPHQSFSVEKYSRPAIGFTRYREGNVEGQAAEQLGDSPVDIAVISFGANDAQNIINDKGEYAALMGPKWQAQIAARLDRFVALLRQHHAMVYWVGLPRMREAGFDADVTAVNAFYAAEMAKLEVPFIDTRPMASDGKGQYSAYLEDTGGKRVEMRTGDGIHMTMAGYLRITHGLADRIRTYVDATRALEPAPAGKP